MKKLLIWAVMCLSLTAQAQVGELFGGTINVFAVDDNAGPVFAFRAFFNEAAGRWTGDSTQVGDQVFVFSGNKVYKLTVDSVLSASTIVNLRVRDSTATLASFPTGVCALMRVTDNNQYPATIPGLPNVLASKITTYFAEQAELAVGGSGSGVTTGVKGDINVVGADSDWQIVADAVGNPELANMPANTIKANLTGSSANPTDATYAQIKAALGANEYCRDTITQTSHGFSPPEAIYYDGTEYVSMIGLYGDSQEPHFLVIDSLTANTFVVAVCGIVNDTFGLAEGLYYSTDTGLSVTPDTVEYPILKVLGDKSIVMSLPGFEFDPIGRELFDVVTVTGQRALLGGQVIPMFPDSIPFLDTIYGTPVQSVGEALDALASTSPASALNDLTDATVTSPIARDFLRYNGSIWQNYPLPIRADTANTIFGFGTPLGLPLSNVTAYGYRALNLLAVNNNANVDGAITAIGAYALQKFNAGFGSYNGPFAIGYKALGELTGANNANSFAVGNGALLNSVGNANEINWAVGNGSGSGITTGWGNMIAGTAGGALATGTGNTIFAIRGLTGLSSSNIGLTAIGFLNWASGNTLSNATVLGYQNTSYSGSLNYNTSLGSANYSNGIGLTIVGTLNGGVHTTSSDGSVLIGTRNANAGVGNITATPGGAFTHIGSNNALRSKTLNTITIGTGNLNNSSSTTAIAIGHNAVNNGAHFAEAAYGIDGDTVILVGSNHGNVPLDTARMKTSTVVNSTTDYLTITAHGWGSAGRFIQGRVNCTSCPSPFIDFNFYAFEVIDANTVKSVANLTTNGDGIVQIWPRKIVNSAITLGHWVTPEARKIKIGSSTHQQLVVNNYKFNVDQSLSGRNGQALRYNVGTGELQVQSDTSRSAVIYEAAVNGNNSLTLNVPAIASNVAYDLPTVLPTGESGSWYTSTTGTTTIRRDLFTNISGSTDASGDVLVAHLINDTNYAVQIQVTDTTPYVVTVHTKTNTTFKVRFFNPTTGAAVASTVVTADVSITDF